MIIPDRADPKHSSSVPSPPTSKSPNTARIIVLVFSAVFIVAHIFLWDSNNVGGSIGWLLVRLIFVVFVIGPFAIKSVLK